ncbi:hypothetical protein B0T10DRAFT_125822 [Thelonectria olida]|uniref:Uncharacterized protein n=1 Tax=Thelonectria olida TaxID=1576542 RepID=A0A9P8WHC0_9HYPO|nr:hypothetical protein B0T10DRAFT_125822 [Thelonectria olida]
MQDGALKASTKAPLSRQPPMDALEPLTMTNQQSEVVARFRPVALARMIDVWPCFWPATLADGHVPRQIISKTLSTCPSSSNPHPHCTGCETRTSGLPRISLPQTHPRKIAGALFVCCGLRPRSSPPDEPCLRLAEARTPRSFGPGSSVSQPAAALPMLRTNQQATAANAAAHLGTAGVADMGCLTGFLAASPWACKHACWLPHGMKDIIISVAERLKVLFLVVCFSLCLFIPPNSPPTPTPSPLSPSSTSLIPGLLLRPSSSTQTQNSNLMSALPRAVFLSPVLVCSPPRSSSVLSSAYPGTVVYGFSRKSRVMYTVDTVCIRLRNAHLRPCRLRQLRSNCSRVVKDMS